MANSNVPGKYWYQMIGTVRLNLGHCPFPSLCGNWLCVIDIFSFVRFLWIFSLLLVLAHLLKPLFQETSLFSTSRWIPSHSNFFAVHVKEPRLLPNSSWSHTKLCLKYHFQAVLESFFKHHTFFPLALAVCKIYDRATITQRQDFDLVVYQSFSWSTISVPPFVKSQNFLGLFFTIISCFALQSSGGR